MKKTTVYLSEDEADSLRRASAETGRSQADLIREGVRHVTKPSKRQFHSMGAGRGNGDPISERTHAVFGELIWQDYQGQIQDK